MLIDSHAHLYVEAFKEDLDDVINRAQNAGVEKICMPNIDETTMNAMHEVREKYPENCFPMMGLHPCSVGEDYEEQLQQIEKKLGDGEKYIAVGEIGVDLYWDTSMREQQIEAFKLQVQWAAERDMAIVIHCRKSIDLVIDVLEELNIEGLIGVFHCFTGNKEQARRILEMGFYIGIGGILTFKNSGLEAEVAEIDLNRIILETDSPYLSPSPKRGKRNEPSHIRFIAEKLSEIKGIAIEEVEKRTTNNVYELYNWS